jgi:NTP pyrophosphatase (non-canonical NTP hydrolase)
MSNSQSIQELQNIVKNFCQERDWDQFHPIKDLAIGISTEANELLDLFRFKSDEQIKNLLNEPQYKEKVEHEVADVFFFILRLAQMNKIDLSQVLQKKLELNALKYPIEKAKGSNKKYNE